MKMMEERRRWVCCFPPEFFVKIRFDEKYPRISCKPAPFHVTLYTRTRISPKTAEKYDRKNANEACEKIQMQQLNTRLRTYLL